ncbi:MAG: lipid-A-disaccharide synthase [Rhodospirillaceae bacterium]|nr:lipid-A-disaccharide synthase [Rhodospirillaceae bacterium]MBT5513988.1 lipid-A-disaccharide synthase [Rhodospirillaceae bacterium]
MLPKLGIIAGGGQLPSIIIQHCVETGRPYFIVALKGQADDDAVGAHPHIWVRLGAAGKAVRELHENKVAEIILAGSVEKPTVGDLRPDLWTASFLAKGAYHHGDDRLLSALIDHLAEEEGFRVIGVDTLLPDLLAPEGLLGEHAPTDADWLDVRLGADAAAELGTMDVGQGVIVANGKILAREDRSGTDAMLARLAPTNNTGGFLVKVSKPEQERRVDLPTIGPATVSAAVNAGLHGLAIEAGSTLIIEREEMIRAANDAGLIVIGIARNDHTVHDTPPPVAANGAGSPVIYMIAGEPSADLLGARLMASLKTETGGQVQFEGVGGPAMESKGLRSLFPMEDLAVMGLAEVLPRLAPLYRRLRQTVHHALDTAPAVMVTIDSPDFSFRVARRLKGKGFPLVHFVAPSVWAWRPKRAAKIAGFLDHLLALLPFEPPYFEREGLKTTYVGHPVIESGAATADGNKFRQAHGIAADEKVLMVLPGSRQGEARRHLPIFAETVVALSQQFPKLRILSVSASPTHDLLQRAYAGWPIPVDLIDKPADKFDAFAAADVALAASGTVSLELALCATPSVIAYRMNPLTAWLAKRLVKVKFANLINLILNEPAVPEFLLENCTAAKIAPAVAQILRSPDEGATQRDAYGRALNLLGQGEESPSRRAARAVLDAMAGNKNGTV